MQEQIEALKREFDEKLENLKQQFLASNLKEGTWVKFIGKDQSWFKHPTNIFRINKLTIGTQNAAKGLTFLYPHHDIWFTGVANSEAKYFIEATDDEITSHLVKEAHERGYKENLKIIDLDGQYPNKIEGKSFQPYYRNGDYFYMCRTKIYEKGKWAEFAEKDEKIMIHKYCVYFRHGLSPEPDTTIDGFVFKKEFWEAAKVVSQNAKIMIGCSKQFDVSLETIDKILNRLK